MELGLRTASRGTFLPSLPFLRGGGGHFPPAVIFNAVLTNRTCQSDIGAVKQ